MLMMGLSIGLVAMTATDLRQDDCVVGAHKAFAGNWSVEMIERVTPGEAAVEAMQWFETNRWIDPYTLVIEQRESFEQPSHLIITETVTAIGFDLIIEENTERTAFSLPLETSCAFDKDSGLYRFTMGFERPRNGVPYDHLIQIDIDTDHYALVRLARPKGSIDERRLLSAQYGKRP